VARNRTALERANVEVDQAQKAKQEFDRQAPQDRERLALLVAHSQGQVKDLQVKAASAKESSSTPSPSISTSWA
jgi:hypothetical protein